MIETDNQLTRDPLTPAELVVIPFKLRSKGDELERKKISQEFRTTVREVFRLVNQAAFRNTQMNS